MFSSHGLTLIAQLQNKSVLIRILFCQDLVALDVLPGVVKLLAHFPVGNLKARVPAIGMTSVIARLMSSREALNLPLLLPFHPRRVVRVKVFAHHG